MTKGPKPPVGRPAGLNGHASPPVGRGSQRPPTPEQPRTPGRAADIAIDLTLHELFDPLAEAPTPPELLAQIERDRKRGNGSGVI